VLSAAARLVVYDDLIDGGGRVLADSQIYTLWWGDPTAFPSDAKGAVEHMLSTLNGSDYLGIVAEYTRGVTPTAAFVRSMSDTGSTPPSEASQVESSVSTELCSVLDRQNVTPDPNSIYVIYGASFPAHSPWTGFHIVGGCSKVVTPYVVSFPIVYIPVPDPAHLLGFPVGGCNGLSAATAWMMNVTAHEVMESITDPFVGVEIAWQTAAYLELADKCVRLSDLACVRLGNQSYLLPGLYSNALHACAH